VFADEEHVPVKRITEKMGNMRKAWEQCKNVQGGELNLKRMKSRLMRY